MKKPGSKKALISIVGAVAVLLIALIVLLMPKSAEASKVTEQLNLGDKYLSELNYEQAIVAYQAVIEIDPKNVDAYLGLADAYVAQGEYEKAVSVLENARSELTGDVLAIIEKKLEEIRTLKENAEVTPTPTMAVSTPKPQKPELILTQDGAMCTYNFNDLTHYMSYVEKYEINQNGTIDVHFAGLWTEAMFQFSKIVDMDYCNKIVVRVKSEDGPVMIKFYGENRFLEIDRTEIFSVEAYGGGIIEYEVDFSADKDVAGIGIMSIADYDDVTASVYDVTFYLDEEYAEKFLTDDIAYTFDFSDMEYYTSYGVEYEIKEDASMDLQFESQYSEIMLKLPEVIDMKYCKRIVINVKSEDSPIAVKFYGEDNFETNSELFALWESRRDIREHVVLPQTFSNIDDNVGGIGIMNIKNFSNLGATVYSITFYMDAEQVGN